MVQFFDSQCRYYSQDQDHKFKAKARSEILKPGKTMQHSTF